MTDLRQYLIRIAVINWLLSLFKANPELCTYEGLMDELAAWFLSDTCALEGCENPLIGYKSDAFYCSDACGKRAWDEANLEHSRDYNKAHYHTPAGKAVRTRANNKYRQSVNGKAKRNKNSAEYRARKKAERLAAIEAE